MLRTASGDIKVCLNDTADITIISDGTSDPGAFADVQADRTAYAFGETAVDGCFLANDLVIETGD
jgi:hypothetical protein